jgi:hypothetical protein
MKPGVSVGLSVLRAELWNRMTARKCHTHASRARLEPAQGQHAASSNGTSGLMEDGTIEYSSLESENKYNKNNKFANETRTIRQ